MSEHIIALQIIHTSISCAHFAQPNPTQHESAMASLCMAFVHVPNDIVHLKMVLMKKLKQLN